MVLTAKFDVLWSLEAIFADGNSLRAVHELEKLDPTMSARTVIMPAQKRGLLGMAAMVGAGLVLAPAATIIAINTLFSVFYLGNFAFKLALAWAGARHLKRQNAAVDSEVALLNDEDLPVFTVLVPMFREPEVLPILANALRCLDYARAKLDIKIVLEADDHETVEAAKALGLEGIFEIIRVPPSLPQTKPKACNYALRYARGEYLVIYDAGGRRHRGLRRYPPVAALSRHAHPLDERAGACRCLATRVSGRRA